MTVDGASRWVGPRQHTTVDGSKAMTNRVVNLDADDRRFATPGSERET